MTMQKFSSALTIIFIPVLLGLTLFVSYLKHHNYPLLSGESLLCFLLITISCTLLGSINLMLKNSRLRVIFHLLLFAVFIDSYIDLPSKGEYIAALGNYNTGIVLLVIGFSVFLVLLILLSLHEHLNSILFISCLVFLASSLLLPTRTWPIGSMFHTPGSQQTQAPSFPSTLYFVLDGHAGIGGIPTDIEGGLELKNRLRKFYTSWGFRAHSNAYSQHVLTQDTMATLLNAESGIPNKDILGAGHTLHRFRLKENQYFDSHINNGASIHVVQSDYLDYCNGTSQVTSCHTYPSVSFRGMRDVDLPVSLKAIRLIRTYFNHSIAVIFAKELLFNFKNTSGSAANKNISNMESTVPVKYFNLAVPRAIKTIEETAIQHPQNALIFSHLLMPHSPYIWNSECNTRLENSLWLPSLTKGRTFNPDPREVRKNKYINYFQQTHCLIDLLDALFKTLDERGLFEHFSVIVHGDHGARHATTRVIIDNIDKVDSTDILDTYSTLFAIRNTTKTSPGIEKEPKSLIELFADYDLLDVKNVDNSLWFRSKDNTSSNHIRWQSVPLSQFRTNR